MRQVGHRTFFGAILGVGLALFGIFFFMVNVFAPNQFSNGDDWSYDWVEISPTDGGVVLLPAPSGDSLRNLFLEYQGRGSAWRPMDSKRLPQPRVAFYKDGNVVRDYQMFRATFCTIQEGGRFYILQDKEFAAFDALITALVCDPDALKEAIKLGNALQRVRAAHALLCAKKEHNAAVDVLRLEVLSKDKKASIEAIMACSLFKVDDSIVMMRLCKALEDDVLCSSAYIALKSIGPPAIATAAIMRDLYTKPEYKKDRLRIIFALSAIDPRSDETQKLFLSCIVEKTDDITTQIAAVNGIALAGENAVAHVPILEKIIAQTKMGNEERVMRFAAIKAIFNIRPGHEELVSWLSENLVDPFANSIFDTTTIVRDSIEILGKIGPAALCALPLIIRHEHDSVDEHYRQIVANAIKQIEKR